jgi:hypothetical protein
MRKLLSIGLLFVFGFSAFADDGNFLNVFILGAPAKYLADIPNNQRDKLILYVSPDNRLLDYKNGWLTYFNDNPDKDIGSSLFWVKLLPRKNDNPLVLVYMAKALDGGIVTPRNQTYILDHDGNGWREVTTEYIPKDLDLSMAFVPCRIGNDIRVAGYREVPGTKNAKGEPYREFDECRLVLHWNGTSFDKQKIKPRKIELYD